MVCGAAGWRCWLRHWDKSRKVAGSIPDGFIGHFHGHNPSAHTMALLLTQPLRKMISWNISWRVKGVGVWGLQLYHFQVPIALKSESLNLLETSGPVQPSNGI